jgi:Domain of unknown function (DUF4440)
MRPNRAWVAVVPLLCVLSGFAQQSAEEVAVWKLEHSYWEDVKAVDLESYIDLWHPNFVGWPSVSPQPVRRDHITDWITANTAKGLHLESYSLEPAASRATENLVVVHYWVTSIWADKDRRGEPHTLRVTHTWMKVGKGWQIISGMSSPEAEVRK